MLEDDSSYLRVKSSLQDAAKSKTQIRQDSELTDIDNLLRFYVVLYAVRQQRQVNDTSLSTCYRYWLAYYYRKDRAEFRGYVNALFPTLKRWLLTDTSWWRRLAQRPVSKWWRQFFRPQDFWEVSHLERSPNKLEN